MVPGVIAKPVEIEAIHFGGSSNTYSKISWSLDPGQVTEQTRAYSSSINSYHVFVNVIKSLVEDCLYIKEYEGTNNKDLHNLSGQSSLSYSCPHDKFMINMISHIITQGEKKPLHLETALALSCFACI